MPAPIIEQIFFFSFSFVQKLHLSNTSTDSVLTEKQCWKKSDSFEEDTHTFTGGIPFHKGLSCIPAGIGVGVVIPAVAFLVGKGIVLETGCGNTAE